LERCIVAIILETTILTSYNNDGGDDGVKMAFNDIFTQKIYEILLNLTKMDENKDYR
jgi:hypothetical protein